MFENMYTLTDFFDKKILFREKNQENSGHLLDWNTVVSVRLIFLR